jgi:hypothetical protein
VAAHGAEADAIGMVLEVVEDSVAEIRLECRPRPRRVLRWRHTENLDLRIFLWVLFIQWRWKSLPTGTR